MQIALSFDTTGSMRSVLKEIRRRLSDMLQLLHSKLPRDGFSTAIIAHGDYCDRKTTYITRHVDFSSDINELVKFVNDVENTHGGDAPEAYEVMLRVVKQDLTWKQNSRKVLVVIGDSYPHSASDPQNVDKIDWKQEAKELKDKGVKIYGVQVGKCQESTQFFTELTKMTGGRLMELPEFTKLCEKLAEVYHVEMGVDFLPALFREDMLKLSVNSEIVVQGRTGSRGITFLMVGRTGNGKSSVGNSILGQQAFKVGGGMSITTKKASEKSALVNDRHVRVIDTPDILNLHMTEESMEDWNRMAQPGPDVILLIIKCDVRFTEDEYRVFEQISRLWSNLSDKLVLAFTFGDNKVKDFRDDIQAGGPNMQKVLQAAKNRYVVFNNKGSAEEKEKSIRELFELFDRMR